VIPPRFLPPPQTIPPPSAILCLLFSLGNIFSWALFPYPSFDTPQTHLLYGYVSLVLPSYTISSRSLFPDNYRVSLSPPPASSQLCFFEPLPNFNPFEAPFALSFPRIRFLSPYPTLAIKCSHACYFMHMGGLPQQIYTFLILRQLRLLWVLPGSEWPPPPTFRSAVLRVAKVPQQNDYPPLRLPFPSYFPKRNSPS